MLFRKLRNIPVGGGGGGGGEVLNIVFGENIRVLVQVLRNSVSGAEMKINLAPRKKLLQNWDQ